MCIFDTPSKTKEERELYNPILNSKIKFFFKKINKLNSKISKGTNLTLQIQKQQIKSCEFF